MACSWPRFKTVLLLSLLTIPKLSKPCIRILPEEGGWKQMSVGERAKLVKVVFIGKVINLYTVDKLSGTYAADFEIWRILKGRKIVDEVFEMHRSSLVKVYGFGEKRLCYSPVKPGDVHMVFMVYEPASRSLVARYDDIFGATAAPTAANENEVLQALGMLTQISFIPFSYDPVISYPMKECLSSGSAPAVVATKITSHFQTSFLTTSKTIQFMPC